MEEEQENQTDSLRPKENSEVTSEEVTLPTQTQSFSSLLPKALSAVLHPSTRATSDPQPIRPPPGRTAAEVVQLRSELQDLRDQFSQMKTQHK